MGNAGCAESRPDGPLVQSRVRFAKDDPTGFLPEVRARAEAYFTVRGISGHADARTIAKAVLLLGFTGTAYALLISGRFSRGEMVALAAAIGAGLAGIAFCIAHDALHGALFASARANRWLGLTSELLAVNGYLWRITHNQMHHVFPNVVGADDDVTLDPVLRLSANAPWRPVHRWQHLYAWPLYACLTLFWAFLKDYKNVLAHRLGPFEVRHPRGEVVRLLLFKASHYAWTIVVPLLVLPISIGEVLVGLLAMHGTVGILLGVTFMLAHVEETTVSPTPAADGRLPEAFGPHQLRTTTDFARGHWFLDAYLGGCNYQVEHHLFPSVCHAHYPALAPIVEETARRHGLPYHAAPTLRAALASHARTLYRLGRPPNKQSGARNPSFTPPA